MADVAPRTRRTRAPQRIQLLHAVPELAEHLGPEVATSACDQLETPVWWDSQRSSAPTYQAGCGVRP